MSSSLPANPKVSVIIPIYGKAGDLPRLVDALQAQSIRPHEIILVDSSPKPIDNPPPGTRLVKNPERIRAVVQHTVEHFRAKVEPNGFKAQVVVFDRERRNEW